jgi:hypothetical protein
MAQLSFPWPGDSGAGGTGDCGPYTADAFSNWYEKLFCSDSTNECVIPNIGNELAVTGTATPVSINTGSALVNGKFYNNSAASTLTISTPAGATRIDRVILRADYAAQTVRLVLLAGAEGGAAPSLTQTDGTTWEVSLAQASITTGGVVTVTDERVFLHFNSDVETNMIEAEAVSAAKIANRTRTFLLHGHGINYTDGTSLLDDVRGWIMTDNKWAGVQAFFYVPADFVSGMTAKAIFYPIATANIYDALTANIAAVGQVYTTHENAVALAARGVTQNLWTASTTLNLTDVAAADVVSMTYERKSTDALDTLSQPVYCAGILISYTADS